MDPEKMAYWLSVLMVAILFTLSLASLLKIVEKEPHEATKRLKTLMLLAYATGFILYGLMSFYFSRDATHFMTVLISLTFLVLLPAILMTASVASIATSNE